MTEIRLAECEQPRASVIVLTRRDGGSLRACLRSLVRNVGPEMAWELILVLNAADADVVAFCEHEVSGARIERCYVNLGFPGGSNLAAAGARGELLVFLNDDTEVAPEWLEALVASADEHPRAGAIGSRLLFPDGSIQEAGGVIWRDGTTAQVGRGDRPGRRRYGCLRRVDYCSAASLLVRRSTWDAVGGFDEDYFPGYYEDVDLCLAIRAHGQQVLYEPRSQVVHHVSPPEDEWVDADLFARNAARVRAKWSSLLACHEPWDADSAGAVKRAVARAQGWPPRILVVGDRLPDPAVAAVHGRVLAAIRELRSMGAAITAFARQQPHGDPELCRQLGFDTVEGDPIDHMAAPEELYDAVIVTGGENLRRYGAAVRALQPPAALIYEKGEGEDAHRGPEAAFAPDVTIGARSVTSWMDLLEQARARRVDAYADFGDGPTRTG